MPVYAFVDKIDASPTILLDLDNQAPLSVVDGTKTPPPTRRVNSVGSTAKNGNTVAQSSYNDRQLTLELSLEFGTTPEQQTEAIQALGRLLDGPQWLMWQHDGMIEPVFFRTHLGDMDVDDEYLTEDNPTRYITVNVMAEPFAYGLPVTGTATIANDPSAAGGMSYVFPDIQGDVATPLHLSVANSAGTPWDSAIGVVAREAGTSPIGVRYGKTFTASSFLSGSAWGISPPPIISTVSDSTAIGGTLTRGTRTSANNLPLVAFMDMTSVPRGDYRLLARVKGSVAGGKVRGWSSNPGATGTSAPSNAPTRTIGTTWKWYDLGVVRAPITAPEATELLDSAGPFNATFGISISPPDGSAGSVDIDSMALMPAGLDEDVSSNLMLTKSDDVTFTLTAPLVVDGVNERVFNFDSGTGYSYRAYVAGSLPRVVPGAVNSMQFFRNVGLSTDDKTRTTVVSWTYYPPYLYVRPATS